ncbi:MAG: hypothetical protein KJ583_05940 [Nanoarchaeota archaeon]|nr:hypothetical protein [Nanoarchaeota archaeon]MBU1270395.1 hypothetical protein [Nanoarchaeota archaeon]MBU1604826.1 hypothetical protein [Nanoarchaeota archaeon]MBU2442809.1 hypothetical protein [Nanoarchaeota archaeon]
MIKDLKKDVSRRAVVFEELARMLIRKEENNNFIFSTRSFDSFNDLCSRYKLDISLLDIELIDFLMNHLHSVDLVGFYLKDNDSRLIESVKMFEVKTKNHTNKSGFDLCFSSYDAYAFLKRKGVDVKLLSFVLFDDWHYSFNIYDINLESFKKYSRYKSTD